MKIKFLGFGKQGIKALKNIAENERIEKCYIDNNSKDLDNLDIPPDNRFIWDFQYELNSCRCLWDLEEKFKSPEVHSVIKKYMEDASLLICITGCGGRMSMLLKEILKIIEKQDHSVPVLVLATIPLKAETKNYTCNVLANRMVDFLQECTTVGYALVDQEKILKNLEGNLFKVVDDSHYWLSTMANEFLQWIDAYETLEREDPVQFYGILRSILCGLVYFFVYESQNEDNEMLSAEKILNSNPFHTYIPNAKSEKILFVLETSRSILYDGYDLCSELLRIFPNKEDDMKGYMVHNENLNNCYRIFFVSAAREYKRYCIRRDLLSE